MSATKLLFTFVCGSALCFGPSQIATAMQAVTVDDFLPPSRGGAEVVKDPSAVDDSGDVITAGTAQDAVLAAMNANVSDLRESPPPSVNEGASVDDQATPQQNSPNTELGAHFVRFPSGQGAVATGASVYTVMPNPNASRVAQRNAYVIAYTRAKEAMVGLLGETTSEGKTVLTEISNTINDNNVTTATGKSQLSELIEQAGNALLKGYVVFSVNEEPDATDDDTRMVFVTIASSPKTQTLTLRNGAMQSVEDLSVGIQNVLDEVQQGLVPPVGGRVVTVANTGESAIIGFGSALVTQGPTPASTARGKLTSRTISAARARDALVGMIDGDKTMWAVGVPSRVESKFETSINYATDNDPTMAATGVDDSIDDFEEQFLSTESVRSDVASIRKGTLPPGVREKHWYSADGHWSYTMVAYYPALSGKASQFAKSMREATLKAPLAESAKTRANSKPRNADVAPLSGGVVSPRDEL